MSLSQTSSPANPIDDEMRHFVGPSGVMELRALDAKMNGDRRPGTISGYFDDLDKLAAAIKQIRSATGIYTTLNPPNPALLARAMNRIRPVFKDPTTSDDDIVSRRNLFIDNDAVRPTGISATNAEHKAALDRAKHICKVMRDEFGWPWPILADSGNGGHLHYRIELPTDDGGLVERVLKAMAARFDDEAVKVDTSCGNAARLIPVYGTMKCKGESTVDRPHRLTRIIKAPAELQIVSRELLEAFADSMQHDSGSAPRSNHHHRADFDLDRWIAEHKVPVHSGPAPWKNGGRIWELASCPWNPAHVAGDAYITQKANGAIGGGCHHNGCSTKNWHDLREVFDPQANRPKQKTAAPKRKATKISAVDDTITLQSVTEGEGLVPWLADHIRARDSFAVDAGRKPYHFHAGVYQPKGESFIRQAVQKILEQHGWTTEWSSHRSDEVVEYICVSAPTLWEKPPLDEINVLNGIVNVNTREVRPHDPKFLSSVQLPVKYDPAAKSKAWAKFQFDVLPGDALGLMYEIAAWLMVPDTSIQKAILCVGEGSNGKSRALAAIQAFIGKRNVANVPLHRLEADKFKAARLVGKLANICADLPSEHLAGTSMFKALTGGDEIEGERKFHDGFNFRPYARLIFSANHPPRSKDSSHAFFRRWLVVPFNKTFDLNDPETISSDVLDTQLADPKELSGVLNMALDALAIIRRQHGFTESKTMKAAWDELRSTTDPLAVWLDASTIDNADAVLPKSELLAVYNGDCQQHGRPTATATAFGLALKRIRPNITDGQRTVGGKLAWCWLGIGLMDSHTSRGSRGYPPFVTSRARAEERGEG